MVRVVELPTEKKMAALCLYIKTGRGRLIFADRHI